MLFRKITKGYVIQVFNEEGEFLAQCFTPVNEVEYEYGDGIDTVNPMDVWGPVGHHYAPYDMVQPDVDTKQYEEAEFDELSHALGGYVG